MEPTEEVISPELVTLSPFLSDLVRQSEGLARWGIDPAFAGVLIASTVVLLRILSIVQQFTAVWAESWGDDMRIQRAEKRAELNKRINEGDLKSAADPYLEDVFEDVK